MDTEKIFNNEQAIKSQNSNIHIYFATDANYLPQSAAAIASILANYKEYKMLNFHILYSDITEVQLKTFEKLKDDWNFNIDFIKINKDDFNQYAQNQDMKHLSIGAFYRFIIPQIAPKDINKVIYLDCDLIVKGDISELFNQDITGYMAGVIEDIVAKEQLQKLSMKSDKYFNSGVLLLNLEEIRKTNFISEILEYFNKNIDIIEFHDQDILNGIWDGKVKFLDDRFNAQSYYFFQKKRYKKMGIKQMQNPVIIHFTGSLKPWQIYCNHPLWMEYFKYLQLTPYKLNIPNLLEFNIKRVFAKMFYISKDPSYLKRYTVFIFGIKLYLGKKVKV